MPPNPHIRIILGGLTLLASSSLEAQSPLPASTEPQTFARFVPERMDDFAWEKFPEFGEFGTGARLEGPSTLQAIRQIPDTAPNTAHILLLAPTDASGAVHYRAGFGWDRAGRFTTFQRWQEYLSQP